MELLAPFLFEVLLSTFGVALLPPQLSGGDAFPPPPFGWCCVFHFILRVLMLPSSPLCGWCCLRPSLLLVVPPALWVPSLCSFLFVGGAAWFPPPSGCCCLPPSSFCAVAFSLFPFWVVRPSSPHHWVVLLSLSRLVGGAVFPTFFLVVPPSPPPSWCCLLLSLLGGAAWPAPAPPPPVGGAAVLLSLE